MAAAAAAAGAAPRAAALESDLPEGGVEEPRASRVAPGTAAGYPWYGSWRGIGTVRKARPVFQPLEEVEEDVEPEEPLRARWPHGAADAAVALASRGASRAGAEEPLSSGADAAVALASRGASRAGAEDDDSGSSWASEASAPPLRAASRVSQSTTSTTPEEIPPEAASQCGESAEAKLEEDEAFTRWQYYHPGLREGNLRQPAMHREPLVLDDWCGEDAAARKAEPPEDAWIATLEATNEEDLRAQLAAAEELFGLRMSSPPEWLPAEKEMAEEASGALPGGAAPAPEPAPAPAPTPAPWSPPPWSPPWPPPPPPGLPGEDEEDVDADFMGGGSVLLSLALAVAAAASEDASCKRVPETEGRRGQQEAIQEARRAAEHAVAVGVSALGGDGPPAEEDDEEDVYREDDAAEEQRQAAAAQAVGCCAALPGGARPLLALAGGFADGIGRRGARLREELEKEVPQWAACATAAVSSSAVGLCCTAPRREEPPTAPMLVMPRAASSGDIGGGGGGGGGGAVAGGGRAGRGAGKTWRVEEEARPGCVAEHGCAAEHGCSSPAAAAGAASSEEAATEAVASAASAASASACSAAAADGRRATAARRQEQRGEEGCLPQSPEAEDEDSAAAQQEFSCALRAVYQVLLFLAHWFGAARFGTDGGGDFDARDLHVYLVSKGLIRGDSARRARSGPRARKRDLQSSPEGAASASSSSCSTGFQQRVGDEDGAGQGGGSVAAAVETLLAENLIKKQHRPWFIICQCCAALFLWVGAHAVEAFAGREDGAAAGMAGLESLLPARTDLRWSSDACEDLRLQPWRWLTYQWTHDGAAHVVTNVVLCVLLGAPLEGYHGTCRTVLIFNVGVFGGACLYFTGDAHSTVVGMAGGCYSLFGMQLAELLMSWRRARYRVPTLLVLLALVTSSTLSHVLLTPADSVSHAIHVGGAVAGFLAAALLGGSATANSCGKVVVAVAFCLGLGLASACLTWLYVQEAPLNVFEALSGEHGWCWFRQVYREDTLGWECVRCGTADCIAAWQQEPNIKEVIMDVCKERGWYYDGR